MKCFCVSICPNMEKFLKRATHTKSSDQSFWKHTKTFGTQLSSVSNPSLSQLMTHFLDNWLGFHIYIFLWLSYNTTTFLSATRDRHVPRSRKDLGSCISRIQDPRSCSILDLAFSFFLGILDILDPVTAPLPWGYRDLRSQPQKILLDPGDPGCSLCELSWDLIDLGLYTTICHCILKIPDI